MNEREVSVEVLPPGSFEQYKERLLFVRHVAYSAVGLADPNLPPSAMEDAFDHDAWFVVAKKGGQIIGALRVHEHPNGERWEFEKWFEFPPDFPEKSAMAEVSKVAVLPEHRWSGASRLLFRRCERLVAELGRRFVLGCSSERLFPLYARAGCQPTSVRFLHPMTQNPSLAFIADVRE